VKRIHWSAIVVAGLLTALLVNVTTAAAGTSTAPFGYHAGDGFAPPLAAPDVAMADNGDTLTLTATGTLQAGAKMVSGGGTFVHRAADGTVLATGTFSATQLLAFEFWGCGGGGLPSFLCGGRASIAVHLVAHPAADPSVTLEHDGVLQITCDLGTPPPGHPEGFTLNVKDVINFNKSVSGNTVFNRL